MQQEGGGRGFVSGGSHNSPFYAQHAALRIWCVAGSGGGGWVGGWLRLLPVSWRKSQKVNLPFFRSRARQGGIPCGELCRGRTLCAGAATPWGGEVVGAQSCGAVLAPCSHVIRYNFTIARTPVLVILPPPPCHRKLIFCCFSVPSPVDWLQVTTFKQLGTLFHSQPDQTTKALLPPRSSDSW
jgi:hypothetical protein